MALGKHTRVRMVRFIYLSLAIILVYVSMNFKLERKKLSMTYNKKAFDFETTVLKGAFRSDRKQALLEEQSFQTLVLPIQRNSSFDYEAAMDKLNDEQVAHVLPIQRNSSFDYEAAMDKLNDEQVAHDDPRLIELIRNYYIVPPSTEPYNLQEDKLDYSGGQSSLVDSTLNFTKLSNWNGLKYAESFKEEGFYVECGAFDGEWGSNSLFFEKVRKWNGVLIEADPSSFEILLSKHRKAFMINCCLNIKPYPAKVLFRPNILVGNIVQYDTRHQDDIVVQCFPLYSILVALNQLRVDFFSLDVEGDEKEILNTIPFEKVDIKTMAVEYVHSVGGEEEIMFVGAQKGYNPLIKLSRPDWRANDIIFSKK